MTSSGISSHTACYSIGTMQRNIKSFKENFQLLGQALKSGDLSAARQAFSSLQELLPASFENQVQSGLQNSHSTFAGAFSALGDALNSRDLSNARDAYATLQNDAKTAQCQPQASDITAIRPTSAANRVSGSGMIDVSA